MMNKSLENLTINLKPLFFHSQKSSTTHTHKINRKERHKLKKGEKENIRNLIKKICLNTFFLLLFIFDELYTFFSSSYFEKKLFKKSNDA